LWPKAGDFPVKAIAALIQKKFQLLNQFIPLYYRNSFPQEFDV
jgi:hypothetical protein